MLKVGRTARGPRRWFVGASGLGLTLFGMGLSMVPPAEGSALLFEAKVVGGAAAFVALGLWLYWRSWQRNSGDAASSA